MSDMPLVSIVVPVYNGSDYMSEAIDSALNQTYKNIEIIVVNDGSNDNGKTEEIALSYGDKIRYIKKDNGGVSSALNTGIKNMKGDYFSWLSHDDVYEPTKIENQICLLNNLKDDNLLAYCSSDYCDSKSNVFTRSAINIQDTILNSCEALKYMIIKGAAGCSFLIPKKVFENVGLFDEKLRYCQDIFMWWNIFLNDYSLVMSSSIGVHYRIHEQQVSHRLPDMYHTEALQIAEMIIPVFAEKSTKNNNYLYYYARGEALHGNKKVFSLCMSKANEKKLFSVFNKISLGFTYCYGHIRPVIRKVYYRFFRKIKTT